MGINIEDFKKHSVLHTLTKKRSPIVIKFLLEDGEDWLVDVVRYKRKSGEVTKEQVIILKDVDHWLRMFAQSGFHKVDE